MGTDIHGVFQRHDGKAWKDVPSEYEFERHYQLFAVLAGVRNGYGFAGVPTGEAVKPIADPRGYPDDFEVSDDMHPIASLEILDPWRRKYHTTDEPLEVWMGDHSHSWLTSTEMLAWKPPGSVVKVGVMERQDYEKWDKKSPPSSYSGDVWGGNVIKIDESEVGKTNKNWTHVSVSWEANLKDELSYFFDEVKRLHDQYGEVRFVFGFDS